MPLKRIFAQGSNAHLLSVPSRAAHQRKWEWHGKGNIGLEVPSEKRGRFARISPESMQIFDWVWLGEMGSSREAFPNRSHRRGVEGGGAGKTCRFIALTMPFSTPLTG